MDKWFIDNREGLHCCICGFERDETHQMNLYNHPTIKHMVCADELPMIKSILKASKKREKE